MPSSRRLAKAIVGALGPLPREQLVVELGPGTGVFTRAIQELLPDNPVLAIERNPDFAEKLQRRFPKVVIAKACASEIRQSLHAHGLEQHTIGGVISGLPLLSLPRPLIQAIFTGMQEVMPAGAPFINFTYSRRSFLRKFDIPGYEVISHRRVYLNVPPAWVLELRQTAVD